VPHGAPGRSSDRIAHRFSEYRESGLRDGTRFEDRPVRPRGQLPILEPDDPVAGAVLRLLTVPGPATDGDGDTSPQARPDMKCRACRAR